MGPVDPLPRERVRHGGRTLAFKRSRIAKRESRSEAQTKVTEQGFWVLLALQKYPVARGRNPASSKDIAAGNTENRPRTGYKGKKTRNSVGVIRPTQLVNRLDEGSRMLRRDIGMNAVTKVEHMSGSPAVTFEDPRHL